MHRTFSRRLSGDIIEHVDDVYCAQVVLYIMLPIVILGCKILQVVFRRRGEMLLDGVQEH